KFRQLPSCLFLLPERTEHTNSYYSIRSQPASTHTARAREAKPRMRVPSTRKRPPPQARGPPMVQ
ncbi:MAG TPA: hypothetical protein VH590_00580, partial [Ktedonobacterales bacterium]